MRRIISLTFGLLLLVVLPVFADNWPAWRGPRGDGIAREKGLPTTWSSTQNVRWKAALPAVGNSTPIVWADSVFLTCGVDEGRMRLLMCFDRGTGELRWQQHVNYSEIETTHRDNPPCSSSPVTDGDRVYVNFGSAGVVAYDFSGNVVWRRDLGVLTHVWGKGSSPILHGKLLIVYRGPGEPTHLYALDRHTGRTVWKVRQRGINSKVFGSWSTPVVIRAAGRDELVMPLPEVIKAYDPTTGKELWRCAGLGTEIYAMPLVGDQLVVGVCGHQGPAMAVRPGGSGDVTETHRLWLHPKNQQRVGSGVVHNGYLYVSNATGIAECLEAATGKLVWRERLGGNLWGSILLADGKLYTTNLEGETFVLDASPEFRVLEKNSLGEHTKAAFAASDGQLFIRTYQNLYCIED